MKTPHPSKAEQCALEKTAGVQDTPVSGLNEQNIPSHLLLKARAWYARQIAELEQKHGPSWPNVRVWLQDHVNAELREHLQKHEVQHGI